MNQPAAISQLMRSPKDLCVWAKQKYQHNRSSWLGISDYGEALVFTFALRIPTEAIAGNQMDEVAKWVALWRQEKWLDQAIEVEWKTVAWSTLGRQHLPTRVTIKGVSSLATLADVQRDWQQLVESAEILRSAWPVHDLSNVLPKLASQLDKLSATELDKFIRVVDWLVDNPESGMLPRQLPIPGVDSKWLEKHRSSVEKLKAALSGVSELGLVAAPVHFNVRVLDPTLPGLRDGDPHAFSASVSELAKLVWQPTWVLIVENAQTLAALPEFSGMVAVFGRGKDVAALTAVYWMEKAEHLLYWGDLDTHGMHILSLARQAFPQIESILMDIDTLFEYADMSVNEPRPFVGQISHLTEAELGVLSQLRINNTRLEQERIDMAYASRIIQNRQR
ncbi:MAG: DUF3322 domain-containing protein [Coriobacteriales bacterium]|jgi:hypothetical protein|nr:DUF3322 domain-containing protein [Coriobacteriales bacterium]